MNQSDNIFVRKPKPICGTFIFVVGLFMLLSLLDYQPEHSKFYQLIHAHSEQMGNRLGILGTSFAFYFCRYLGASVWLLPIYFLWAGLLTIFGYQCKIQKRKIVFFITSLLCLSSFSAFLQTLHIIHPNYKFYSAGIGGCIGLYLFKNLFSEYLGSIGTFLFLLPMTCFSLCLSFSKLDRLYQAFAKAIHWFLAKTLQLLTSIFYKIKTSKVSFKLPSFSFLKKIKLPRLNRFKGNNPISEDLKSHDVHLPSTSKPQVANAFESEPEPIKRIPETKKVQQNSHEEIADATKIQILESEKIEKATDKIPSKTGDYQFPELNLLKDPPPIFNDGSNEDYYETANDLVQKLAEFGVEVKVEAIQSGPVITRYEVTPARGVRVEKITTLDKNIALGLKALSVRIQAPVPGKGCVGIEIPNKKASPVCLKEILGSKAWAQTDAEIPIVLGKEVTGKPIVADLTKMPHLLIAGSTGSGKTVCINAIIASLLFRASPKDLRFIMVDPKIVEMKIYNDLPHMLIPVVTDPKRVPSALKWLIGEMERRYQLFANYGSRNIAGFNEKIKKMSEAELAEKHLEHLPYIVCIIDELADLMMVAPSDIETCIARLAQLARAAGIHLIIATQRPSVNVITGIIKANLPSRIAFKVASKVDSRTILDMGGADSLIGKGDMLFIPPGASQLVRAQGAWVSDDEITNIVEFLKCNGAPQFAEDVQRMIESEASDDEDVAFSADGDDPLLSQALDVLKTSDRISTSLLQRRLKIGYNRAARIMETLTERGLVPKDME